MAQCFGEAAARLYSAAVALLGWRPDEFWNATPTELMSALQPPGEAPVLMGATEIEELRRRFPDQ